MSAAVICHPTWVTNWGLKDVQRRLEVFEREAQFVPGSRFLHVTDRTPMPRSDSVLRETIALFRPNPQRNR